MVEENKNQEEKKETTGEKEHKKPQLLEEPIKVIDYIYLSILSFEGKAWAYMDLIAHPETQKHKKDLAEAKLAIDTMDTLFKSCEAYFSAEQKKDIQNRLTNLKLNFAQR